VSHYMNILQIANVSNVRMHGVGSRNTAIHANVLYSGVVGEITLNRRNIE
jgi:hypothetical protein